MDNYTRGFLREEDLVPSSSMTENVLRMFSPIRIANALAPVAHDNEGHYSLALPSAIADPMESWKGMVDRHRAGIQDDESDARDAFSVAGSVGLGSVAATPLKPMNALGAMGKGIRAYHGSPYDFDKFDLSRIGTGEGAQVYGHGLYFAEAEPVAESYTKARDWRYKGKKADTIYTQLNDLSSKGGLDDITRSDIYSKLPFWEKVILGKSPRAVIEEANIFPEDYGPNELAYINSLDPTKFKRKDGRMYEVNIQTDPNELLDWDKSIQKQPETFRPVFEKYGKGIADTADLGTLFNANYRHGRGAIEEEARKVGIKGIRYFDQKSRKSQDGTRNYVVFDPEIIEILRKYANPPTSSAVPLSVESNDNNQSQPLRGGFGPRWETKNALAYQ